MISVSPVVVVEVPALPPPRSLTSTGKTPSANVIVSMKGGTRKPGAPACGSRRRCTERRMISSPQSRMYASYGLSTHFHKYGDVCWERDGAQIEARRRVDAGTSARRSNKKMGPSRPNPSGGWGLRAISLSLVVVDVPASTPPHLRDLASQALSANVTVFMKGST